ncbi:unnamed protein product [Camellia sinensis]
MLLFLPSLSALSSTSLLLPTLLKPGPISISLSPSLVDFPSNLRIRYSPTTASQVMDDSTTTTVYGFFPLVFQQVQFGSHCWSIESHVSTTTSLRQGPIEPDPFRNDGERARFHSQIPDPNSDCRRFWVLGVREVSSMTPIRTSDVTRALGILKVSAAIGFDAGVLSYLEYLEAAPWAEDEEEKVASVCS